MGYIMTIPRLEYEDVPGWYVNPNLLVGEYREWCDLHLGYYPFTEHSDIGDVDGKTYVMFESEEDSLLFKLKWL
jgi:hypothetical protein